MLRYISNSCVKLKIDFTYGSMFRYISRALHIRDHVEIYKLRTRYLKCLINTNMHHAQHSDQYFTFHDNAALAAGNTPLAKRHVPKLQPSPQLHKPGLEPKPSWLKKEKLNTKAKPKGGIFLRRKLEENLGIVYLGSSNGWPFHLEVLSV